MSVPNVGKTHYRSGGTRGGADRFDWNDVKSDTYRENYIGHSLHAQIGRWYAGGKDHLWWTKQKKTVDEDEKEKDTQRDSKKRKRHKKEKKDKKRKKRLREERGSSSGSDQDHQKEKLQMKKMEEDMMAQALGLAPRREIPGAIKQLNASEMKELLQKGTSERTEIDGERIRGLGSGSSKRHDFVAADIRKRGRDANYFANIGFDSSTDNTATYPTSSSGPSGSGTHDVTTDETDKKIKHEKKSKKKAKSKKKKKKTSARHDTSDEDSADERLQKLLKQTKHRFY